MTVPHDPQLVRRLALAMPGAVEQDHHGFPSFRVHGKIFATLPNDSHAHIMLPEADIRSVVRAHPNCCEGKLWGKRLAALRVSLADAAAGDLEDWITDAWEWRSGA